MTLEAAGTIDELEPLYPEEGAGVAGGNEHIQLLKSVLKAMFPGNTELGLFDTDITLGTVTGTGTKDLYINGLDAQGDATIVGRIETNPQVAIALFTLDSSGNTVGPINGVVDVGGGVGETDKIATGRYEVRLQETAWASVLNDLVVTVHCSVGLGAGIGLGVNPTVNDMGDGWIQILTYSPDAPLVLADATGIQVAVFDKGRG
jgi:hypothetical protein